MIKNYFTVAIRNFRRNLSAGVINLAGLSLGITCCLVLMLMIFHFSSYDNYHPHGDRLFRVVTESDLNGRMDHQPGVPVPFATAFKEDISGIASVLFISASDRVQLSREQDGERDIYEEIVAYTDSSYLRFFSRQLLEGSGQLSEPDQAIVSVRLADKLFGNTPAVGQVIRVGNSQSVVVTGVMDDYPDNTSFPFDILVSFSTIRQQKEAEGWGSIYSDDQCYVILEPGVSAATINEQFPAFNQKYLEAEEASRLSRWLQPLSEIHRDERFGNYLRRTVASEYLLALGFIALFLILTASINFINLSTAVAVKRSREVGIRKVLGSQRRQLVIQYLTETGLITLAALILANGFAELALLRLNPFLEVSLHIDWSDATFLGLMLLIWLLVTVLAGLYPAFLLSGYSPLLALRNKMASRGSGAFFLRRALVIVQFVISQLLVIGTLVLMSQMQYVESKDMGFQKEAIINFPIPEASAEHLKRSLKTRVEAARGVELVSLCYQPPASSRVSITDARVGGTENDFLTHMKMADESFIDLYGLSLVAGTGLKPGDTASAVVVNEKLVAIAGLENPQDAIGRVLDMSGNQYPIAGVVRDFHTTSLQNQIDPTVLFNALPSYRTLAVRVRPGDPQPTIEAVRKIWQELYPDNLFHYEFMDEQIARFYASIRKMTTMLTVFAAIAIFIGCLGLYGLISFMATQKEKEIGIRKVLGARVTQILGIFSGELAGLMLIAFLLAAPLAGYLMSKWLENFEYRITLHWALFVSAIALTLFIASATVAWRSIRAARLNPADILRSE